MQVLPISTWKSGEVATKDSSRDFSLIKGLQCCFLLPKFPRSFTLAFHSHSTIKRAHKKGILKIHLHSPYSLKATETAEIMGIDWS